MLSLLNLLVVSLSYFDLRNTTKKEIFNFYALALHIYNNFDLCLSIFSFLYIKCGSYLLVEFVLVHNECRVRM